MRERGTRTGRLGMPAVVFLATAAVYVAMLGPARLTTPSPDNHYAHLAASWLAGELGVLGDAPPGRNDWACFDAETRGPCPPGRWSFPTAPPGRYRWYGSFPPFPAVVILPAVAVLGVDWPDRLFWALLAGLGPAALYALLRSLREAGRTGGSRAADLGLTALFAFGSVWFFRAGWPSWSGNCSIVSKTFCTDLTNGRM